MTICDHCGSEHDYASIRVEKVRVIVSIPMQNGEMPALTNQRELELCQRCRKRFESKVEDACRKPPRATE